jgi:hypothetical protein
LLCCFSLTWTTKINDDNDYKKLRKTLPLLLTSTEPV